MSIPKTRILIVDDERSIADTLALILGRAGYQVTAAYSGESAISLAQITTPDLIVSDIQMPGIDGISASLEIRKVLPDCHVLLFSGYPEAHLDRALSNGFNILTKPLSPQMLLKHIELKLRGRAKGNGAGC
jgi:CheY-like chemotaxis protein